MAPDSNTLIGLPPGPSGSTIAGMRLFGLIFRNSGLNCSPLEMFTGCTVYGSPISSSATLILRPLGVFQVQSSMLMSAVLPTRSFRALHFNACQETAQPVVRLAGEHLARRAFDGDAPLVHEHHAAGDV